MSPQSEVSLTEKNRFFGFCLQKGWGGLTQFKNGFIIKKCEVFCCWYFHPKGRGSHPIQKAVIIGKLFQIFIQKGVGSLPFQNFLSKNIWGFKFKMGEGSGGGDVFWKNNSFLWLSWDALDNLSEFVDRKIGGIGRIESIGWFGWIGRSG